ncbi:(2Fe-2S)-binding protein [Fodinisporobacter ferrooxydans]|uniref:(2Fe-2S)-binding protein n=1 Tax=Fodinisporobacter ferrooxydans TaxID=2901836 RepID=A0ABY4CR99_9BACL|nr:(2Fe-2S)-binding protein [Alicyclobacillaceae bacterium MYW30-H2]
MPKVRLHRNGQIYEQEVPENSNLVVLAGTKKFPQIRYGCGMGRCTRCVSRVLAGGEHLPEPNWKEVKRLGEEKLKNGYRLTCQLWITHDIELLQEN